MEWYKFGNIKAYYGERKGLTSVWRALLKNSFTQALLNNCNIVSRALDCRAEVMSSIPGPNQYLRCENNWKKKVLPFPCKWQDLRVVPMNTYNNGPVSGRALKKLFSISIFVLDTLIHRVHFSRNVSTCTTVPFNIFTGCVRRWQV